MRTDCGSKEERRGVAAQSGQGSHSWRILSGHNKTSLTFSLLGAVISEKRKRGLLCQLVQGEHPLCARQDPRHTAELIKGTTTLALIKLTSWWVTCRLGACSMCVSVCTWYRRVLSDGGLQGYCAFWAIWTLPTPAPAPPSPTPTAEGRHMIPTPLSWWAARSHFSVKFNFANSQRQ